MEQLRQFYLKKIIGKYGLFSHNQTESEVVKEI